MGEAAKVISFYAQVDGGTENKTTRQRVENTFSEELVIGLCAPIGTNRQIVIDAIIKRLKEDYNYECEIIKLSDFISQYSSNSVNILAGKTK
ncbi:hypothetical protein [Pontibacter pudoricolor]|uniref:hypothetical protein n=1 Tax=Pontibacter pudoricolor TaxID=2694930 RepID=UPI001390AAF6|nr:hypothetical protein [Pontibacter pudoricolor]